jgi:hypothetical protein
MLNLEEPTIIENEQIAALVDLLEQVKAIPRWLHVLTPGERSPRQSGFHFPRKSHNLPHQWSGFESCLPLKSVHRFVPV